MLLNDYIFRLQRLLHDADKEIWPVTPDLTTYVNMARDRVCLDTHCARVLPIIQLNAIQERYNYSYVLPQVQNLAGWLNGGQAPPARTIGEIIAINCIQNSSYQPPLKKLAWSELNVQYRQQGPLNPASFPSVWAPYEDGNNFYIANVPGDSSLTAEVDCVYLPSPLVLGTDPEIAIFDPVSELVPLMAARYAMYYMDEQDTAAAFWSHYKLERDEMMAGLPPFSGYT